MERKCFLQGDQKLTFINLEKLALFFGDFDLYFDVTTLPQFVVGKLINYTIPF